MGLFGQIANGVANDFKNVGSTVINTFRELFGAESSSTPLSTTAQDIVNIVNKPTQDYNNAMLGMMQANNAFNAAQADKQMAFQQQSAQDAMNFNAAEAQKNREWQEMMSNTSYQRAVADMKKAGLNPILAVNQGGASTPGGRTASGMAMGGASAHSAGNAMIQKEKGIIDIFSQVAMTGLSAMNMIQTMKGQNLKNERMENVNKWFS